MADILAQIVADKKKELEGKDFSMIRKALEQERRETNSLRLALEKSMHGVIAEFKRRSPSKGWINEEALVADIIPGYIREGAVGSSILTNEAYFGGVPTDLQQARAIDDDFPLLRKEFIVDENQIYEACYLGADAILLIAACLEPAQTKAFAQLAHELDLEVLLEIHDHQELKHLNEHVDMLGVNNRNLGSFDTDIQRSFDLINELKNEASDFIWVSESGISQPETIKSLREAGFRGFLMGETFMKHEDPSLALRALLENI